jgi:bacterioferritin-associated ferredoxin
MLVCHCLRVFDGAIRECVRSGARSVDDVSARCGAGTGCGGCLESIEAIVRGNTQGSAQSCAERCPDAAERQPALTPLRIAA